MIENIELEATPQSGHIPDGHGQTDQHVYVVFDTVMFSSSVVTLLDEFVEYVRPVSITQPEELLGYIKSDEWIVGGEPHNLDFDEDVDFHNSVHHIRSVLGYRDYNESKAVLLSNNGASAAHSITTELDPHPDDVFICAPTNVSAVADLLLAEYEDTDDSVTITLYCSGSGGHPAFEDILTAWRLYEEIEGLDMGIADDIYDSLLRMFIENVGFTSESWYNEEDIDHVCRFNDVLTVPQYNFEEEAFENGYPELSE